MRGGTEGEEEEEGREVESCARRRRQDSDVGKDLSVWW